MNEFQKEIMDYELPEMENGAASKLLRERFDGREHWLLVCDAEARVLFDVIIAKYYANKGPEDLTTIVCRWNGGHFYGIGILRKRLMLAHKYQSVLRQIAKINLTEREILSRDVMICTVPRLQIDAATMIDQLLSGTSSSEDRTPFDDIPVVDGQIAA